MSEALSIGAIIISGCSFLFAVLSFTKSHSIEKRQLAIVEERRSEEKAASLIAYFHSSANRRTLRIENKGNGEARNITVILDGQALEQHPCWVSNQPNRITTLGGQGCGDYILVLSSSNPFPKMAEIHWEDDVKKNNVSRNSLTV